MLSIQSKITKYTHTKKEKHTGNEKAAEINANMTPILALANKDFRTTIIKVLKVKVNILKINGEIVSE